MQNQFKCEERDIRYLVWSFILEVYAQPCREQEGDWNSVIESFMDRLFFFDCMNAWLGYSAQNYSFKYAHSFFQSKI